MNSVRSTLTALALLIATPALADDAAEAYISDVLTDADDVFNASDKAARLAAIAELVNANVDLKRVSRFVLGRYARIMTPEQRAAYEPLFARYATQVYQNALSDYAGQRLEVTGSVDRSETDIIVDTRVVGAAPNDQFDDLDVHWRVLKGEDGGMSVVDAGAAGIWLAIEQRSQFRSVIADNGGGAMGIDALIAELRRRVGE
ncbi:MAG: phospholipid-binding protein MlaC [Parvularculaceae bacterium]